jgi:hypothetical protein
VKNVLVLIAVTRDTLNGVCIEVGASVEVVLAADAGRVSVVCTAYVTVLTGGGFAGEDVGAAGIGEDVGATGICEDVGAAGLCEDVGAAGLCEDVGAVGLCEDVGAAGLGEVGTAPIVLVRVPLETVKLQTPFSQQAHDTTSCAPVFMSCA